jgi:TorA maturation chaperone TorD
VRPPADRAERAALRAVADLIGRMLLLEVSAPDLARLREPEIAAALADLGVALPGEEDQDAWLEQRGADYHDLFLRPEAGPLIQSLWTQGRHEGDATVRVRRLAEAAGVEYSRPAARGAPIDHLGSLLLLWSATDEPTPAVADEVARAHLSWAKGPLRRIALAGGFYGAVAAIAGDLISRIEIAEAESSMADPNSAAED